MERASSTAAGHLPSTAPKSQRFHLPRRVGVFAVLFLLLIGFALRVYKFPSLPVGLHQDEMSEAYESYSLLHTGKDRWGYRWPAYFLSWGSGQNVMQSYLSIPAVAVLGLTKTSARIVPLIGGLLALPLMFLCMRRWHGATAALAALCFFTCSPWGVMVSRLGIENVELPFFLLLGLYTFTRALESTSRWVIFLSLLPLAGALYCYGTVVVVMPGLLLGLFLVGFRSIVRRPRAWVAAFVLFVICSAPVGLFVIKNYVAKRDFGFERSLPFSTPLLPMSRLDQARAELAGDTLLHRNFHLLRHGFADQIWWFQVPDVHPLPGIVFGLALVGLGWQCWTGFRQRRVSEPFVPWLIACVPIFLLFPLNISRAMAVFVPILALAGVGFRVLLDAAARPWLRLAFTAVCGVLFAVPTIRFVHDYYGSTYQQAVAPSLYPDLPEALGKVQTLAGAQTPIYVSDTILLNYVDVLFYTKTDPRAFQASGATWDHPDFGRYRFERDSALGRERPLAFLLAHAEPPPCPKPAATENVGALVVGLCP